MPLKFCWLCSNSPLSRWQRISLPPSMARRFGAVRIDGLCNRTAPNRRAIDGGSEILCHRDSGELLQSQQNFNGMTEGAYA